MPQLPHYILDTGLVIGKYGPDGVRKYGVSLAQADRAYAWEQQLEREAEARRQAAEILRPKPLGFTYEDASLPRYPKHNFLGDL